MSGGWVRRLLAVVAVALMASGATMTAASTARAAGSTGTVYVVHAVVEETVDIFVDGENVCPDAAPKTVVGPLRLEAGSHELVVKQGDKTLLTTKFTVKGGSSTDVVVHPNADTSGTLAATVFPNNVKPIGRGKARIVVTHVALAPPADIRIDGKAAFRNVASGESLWLDVPAKTYKVDIVPTTGGPAILDPVSLSLPAGKLTRVFAIGDPAKGTMDAVVQKLDLSVVGAAAPTSVQTGGGGQAAGLFADQGLLSPTGSAVVALVGMVLLAASRVGRGRAAEAGMGSRHAR
jgi:Domain of unknown function (DUF4397)